MSDTVKNVVSMLASEEKVMIITAEGEVLDMKTDGVYDTIRLANDLTPQLTGGNVVTVDLKEYLAITKALIPDGYEAEGIVVNQVIDGKTVQGIFYPSKVQVQVQHEDEMVTIPDVEKLEKHAIRAASENSPSVRNFLRRIAPVVKDRLHSAEDLMSFIERSELPLTNDGLIIGYKRVNRNSRGMFVDCHSGKIEQQVGSQVWMEVDMVDPSRHNSCSTGLHVANLGYLRSFHGSHTLIVLVDPANFIAVPHGETNKARVCEYDVIGVMTSRGHELLDSGEFVKGEQTFEGLIKDAVAGRSIQPFERIQVGAREILSREKIREPKMAPVQLEEATTSTKESSGKSLQEDTVNRGSKKEMVKMAKQATGSMPWDTAPKEVIAVFEDMRLEKGSKSAIAALHGTSTRTMGRWADKYDYDGYVKFKESSLTVAERARMMFTSKNFTALADFRRAKKKGWAALGFSAREISTIEKALA